MKSPLRLFIAIFLSFLFSHTAFTQSESSDKPDSVYSFVDHPPAFPGGILALNDYLSRAMSYPEQAVRDSVEGRVYIGFVVEPDGNLSQLTVLRGIGSGCDEEAVRLVGEMPPWKPGRLNGEAVRVSKTLPVVFSLASLPDPKKIYLEADSLPSFKGGLSALNKYLAESKFDLESVPDSTPDDATVYVYFVVETDGSISNVKVKDSVGFGYDEMGTSVVQNMPKWNPGKIGNTNVRVLLRLPVDFNVYQVVEEQPEFPGGMSKLYVYLQKNVKYPPAARESGIQGRVYVNFVIEKDGAVSRVRVIRGIGGGCDEEAVRVVKNMPRWKPGVQRGKPVRVSFNLPIKFTLQVQGG